MSIVCLSHVMRHSEAQLGARLVLFVLAEHAHDDGSEARPSVATLSERTRMSRRAVQAALRRLESDGAIARDGVGSKGQTQWRVILGGADSSPPQDLGGEVDDVGGRSSRQGGGEAASPEPSKGTVQDPETDDQPAGAREPWSGVPDELRADAMELLRVKHKVSGRLVTEREMQIAAAALAEFNRQAESSFGLGAQLTRMVGRIRERPSWDAAKHVRLVQSAWRVRWWERRGRGRKPEPRVIYGNTDVFEMVTQDAMNEAAARHELEQDRSLRGKRWPDGRTFEELAPAEQANAREAVMMGLRPWEAREQPQQPSSNGNGHVDPVTAETFLRG